MSLIRERPEWRCWSNKIPICSHPAQPRSQSPSHKMNFMICLVSNAGTHQREEKCFERLFWSEVISFFLVCFLKYRKDIHLYCTSNINLKNIWADNKLREDKPGNEVNLQVEAVTLCTTAGYCIIFLLTAGCDSQLSCVFPSSFVACLWAGTHASVWCANTCTSARTSLRAREEERSTSPTLYKSNECSFNVTAKYSARVSWERGRGWERERWRGCNEAMLDGESEEQKIGKYRRGTRVGSG